MAYPNKYIRNPKTGQSFLFVQTASSTGGTLLEMQSEYDARSTEPPLHYHPYQTENFKVLQGVLTVRMHHKKFELRKGDCIHIPPNTAHAMWNDSDESTLINWQVTPAMQTEYLLENFVGLAINGKTDKSGKPRFLQSVLLAKHFVAVFRLAKPSFMLQKIVFALIAPIAKAAGYQSIIKEYID